ncbi:MAG: hypothetical protein FWD44_07710 [Oscillospiraceae bacterium]|nr:hypothetical protein [Oscillospiraceae bacterium]
MEKTVRKKNSAAKTSSVSRKADETNKSASKQPARHSSKLETLGINLDQNTVKQAIILSEIIGKPVSKRGRRR